MSQAPSLAPSLEFDLLDRLAKSLRVSGMKPGDMAVAIDVHRNTIGNYLHGKTPMDRRTLIAWAFACAPEVTVEWLETGAAPAGSPDGGGDGPSGSTHE
ncbi:helix-turn-helix transcriptional regulator [Nocardioides sp. LHD-245]|uniref:helix-turn-helix domain-containing protein n=1 Tax=Nocardioides sp. LHD-245 TaxID=3051387 RepID=UPI0027DF3021|nr:helix-turn-helix transcriptional regulator [Nocardioides sp. LHD-245]